MHVSIHLATSFAAAWENVLLPWFERVAPQAFQQTDPVAVLTPSRSHAQLLRNKLLARGISLLDVRFLGPAQLREFLLRDNELQLPLREHLRLLLAIAAEECCAHSDSEQPDSLIARAVTRDPDYVLRLFDELGAAGWDIAEVGQPVLARIATQFKKMCGECDFAFVYEADRHAAVSAEKLPPRFSRLLVTGFDGAHWPLWPLLNAAVKSSQEAVVILTDPRDQARDIDETWVGTWEEVFAEALSTYFQDQAPPKQPGAKKSAAPGKINRVHPVENQDTAHFWQGLRDGKLLIQRCKGCNTLRHPPQPMCEQCQSLQWDCIESTGKGTIYTYTVMHYPEIPPFDYPNIIVLVELEEGVRIVSQLTDCKPDAVQIGMAVEMKITEVQDGMSLPLFHPVAGA